MTAESSGTATTPAAGASDSGAAAAPDSATAAVDSETRHAIALILVAAFMVLMDVSILNLAAPSIQASLGASFGEIQLMVALYQVAYAATLVTGGRLGDILGVRTMFTAGILLFTAASIACAAAGSPGQLIAFRVVQGAGAALMYPQVLATIQILVAPERRVGALAALGAVTMGATIVGPLVAGVVIDPSALDASWRIVFLVNVPIGLVAAVLGLRLVPPARHFLKTRLDVASVLVLTAALVCLMLPLTVGREHDWPAWSWISLAAAPLLLALFIPLQARVAARGRPPLLPPSLWHDRAFRIGVALYVIFFVGMVPFFLYYSYVVQFGAHLGPLDASLALVPYAIGSAVSATASRGLIARFGAGPVAIAGALVCAAGTALMLVPMLASGPGSLPWTMIGPMALTGVGLGLVIPPLLFIVLAGIRSAEAGAASGLLATAQQVGGALGVAVLGVIVLAGGPTESLLTVPYGELTDDFAWALVAIVGVFLATAALLALLVRPRAEAADGAPDR